MVRRGLSKLKLNSPQEVVLREIELKTTESAARKELTKQLTL